MKVLITGRPGVGKTTVLKKVVAQLEGQAHGFLTAEVRDEASGKRRGFSVTTTEGEHGVFADVSFDTPLRVSAYKVDLARFEALALPALEKALQYKKGIVVIDEIGKMELLSERFVTMMESLIEDPDVTLLATVQLKDFHPVVKAVKAAADAVIFQITEANRDDAPAKVLAQLKKR